MAESSDRALLPDETACVTAARDRSFCAGLAAEVAALTTEALCPFEEP